MFRYIRILFFLTLIPILYLFWEWGGATALLNAVKPPVTVSAIRVGTESPDFTLPAEKVWSRQDFRFSSLRGYPVVLHFWATWCGPCLQELPELLQLADRLRPLGYSFVAVAVDENWAVLEKFFLQYPHLKPMQDRMVLLLDPNSEIAQKFGSNRFPESFLINDQFFIDNKFVGAQPWNEPGMNLYLENLRTAAPSTRERK